MGIAFYGIQIEYRPIARWQFANQRKNPFGIQTGIRKRLWVGLRIGEFICLKQGQTSIGPQVLQRFIDNNAPKPGFQPIFVAVREIRNRPKHVQKPIHQYLFGFRLITYVTQAHAEQPICILIEQPFLGESVTPLALFDKLLKHMGKER